jgi:hypothetical protein|tara:strand:- start:171 stop:734 length:564 start_codon:yes stop_codon:yes gene_type:complete
MNKLIEKFRNGIFLASSRTYGEIFMEPIIRKWKGLSESDTDENDGVNDNGDPEEIKCSKVLLPIQNKKAFLLEKIMTVAENNVLTRLISFANCLTSTYGSNIQNIKRDHFSKLVYVMLFEDCIKIFESDKEDISKIPNWCEKHGRYDALGKSGQFNITKSNIEWHLENNLVATLTWDEVYEIAKDIS